MLEVLSSDNPFCRIQTPLEIASAGLRMNKTKSLAFCDTQHKGRGVLADENIQANDFVCEYKYACSYPLKAKQKIDEEYELNGEGCYVLEVQVTGGKVICLDATANNECWGRYINHSRRPNLKMFKPLMVRGKWRVAFLATRDIDVGEELGFDYGRQRNPPDWMKRRKVIY